MPKLSKNKRPAYANLITAATFMLVFAAIGVKLIFFSHAATLTGDLNGDNKVDLLDLSIMLAHWQEPGITPYDLSGNQKVDVFDLSILLSNYGKTATAAAPVSTALPTISGTATQGQTLSATPGSWNNSPTSYGYQWQDCDSAGANCTSIAGATSTTYILTANDATHTIRVMVTATNSSGSASATSAQTAVVASGGGGTPIKTEDPALGPTQLGWWQGCHSGAPANDGWDSIRAPVTWTGRQMFAFDTVLTTDPAHPTTSLLCANANHVNTAVTSLDYSSVWLPPTPAAISAGQDDFWMRTTVAIPSGYPTVVAGNGGHMTLYEIFGAPFSPGPAWDLAMTLNNDLVLTGGDQDSTGTWGAYSPALKDFGTMQQGFFYDFLFHFRMNTFSVVGGNNVSNHDGWFEAWESTNQSPTFQVGSPLVMSNPRTAYKFGTQTNVTRMKIDFWQPGHQWPLSGTGGNNYMATMIYAGPTWPTSTTYHGITKLGHAQADVVP